MGFLPQTDSRPSVQSPIAVLCPRDFACVECVLADCPTFRKNLNGTQKEEIVPVSKERK